MTDQITGWKTIRLTSDNSVYQHWVDYSLDTPDGPTSISIEVSASEMTDPSDENELKTKANAKATAIKQTLGQYVSNTSNDINGNVSL